jgi:hypothetical protein
LVEPLVADPTLSATGDPKSEPSILNWIEPVGVPRPLGPVTVALKLIDCPKVDGFTDEDSTVVVLAELTVWLKFGEVLPPKLASPEYTAVMVCAPLVSAEVVTDAVPPERVCSAPRFAAPSLNCTVPVGLGPPPTVAVKVTDAPNVELAGPVTVAVLARLITSVVVAV